MEDKLNKINCLIKPCAKRFIQLQWPHNISCLDHCDSHSTSIPGPSNPFSPEWSEESFKQKNQLISPLPTHMLENLQSFLITLQIKSTSNLHTSLWSCRALPDYSLNRWLYWGLQPFFLFYEAQFSLSVCPCWPFCLESVSLDLWRASSFSSCRSQLRCYLPR